MRYCAMRKQHVETVSGDRLVTDHRAIRDWAELHKGTPAIEQSKDRDVSERLCLRFSDDAPNDDVYEISWGEFFQRFEAAQLMMRVSGSEDHEVTFERRRAEA